jgi:Uma2 family endonuclease
MQGVMSAMAESRISLLAGPSDLWSGDKMSREEFHRLYEQTPPNFKAELVGGIVYVASPLALRHGTSQPPLTTVLFAYFGNTPGVQVGDNSTILLGDDAEPQPDLFLRILPECGGQSRTVRLKDKDYVEGAPELIAEVAHSSRSIDLHGKRSDYTRHGVLEYLVLSLEENRLRWFDLCADKELEIEPDGILRGRSFPGLWIDSRALLANDYHALMASLNRGLATPEHADFVKRLTPSRAG